MGMYMQAMVCMWRPEDNLRVLSFHHLHPRVKLVGQHLYLLSHLSGPQKIFKQRENLHGIAE